MEASDSSAPEAPNTENGSSGLLRTPTRPSLQYSSDEHEKTFGKTLEQELGMALPELGMLAEVPDESELQVFDGDFSIKDAIHKLRRDSRRASTKSGKRYSSKSNSSGRQRGFSGISISSKCSYSRGSMGVSTPRGMHRTSGFFPMASQQAPQTHLPPALFQSDFSDTFSEPRAFERQASARSTLRSLHTEPGLPEESGIDMSPRTCRSGSYSSGDATPKNLLLKKSVMKVMHVNKFLGSQWTIPENLDRVSTRVIKENSNSLRMMIAQELMALPIFSTCCSSFLNYLARTVEEVSIPQGEQMTPEEEVADPHMVLVLRGSLQAKLQDHEVLSIGHGEYFGEAVLLGLEQDWKAILTAEANTTLCKVYREDFEKALRFFPNERQFYEGITNNNMDRVNDGTLVHPCVVFRGLSDPSILDLDSNLLLRVYFPGQKLIEEGRPGDELYMLNRGKVSVEIAGRTVREERRDSGAHLEGDGLLPEKPIHRGARMSYYIPADDEVIGNPVCFGELGLLGTQTSVRTASVVAQSTCLVRILYRSIFQSVLEQHGESIQMDEIVSLLDERYKDSKKKPRTAALKEVQIFQKVGCSDEFLDFLAQHLEDRIFLSGQRIIDENGPDDRCMYLLGQGRAKVLKENVEVATLQAGAVFGEIIVLGLAVKRTATVVASETCYMQVLHQTVVVRGLELFPEERRKVLMMAFSRSGDDSSPRCSRTSATEIQQDKRASMTRRAFLKALKQSNLFNGIDPNFVEELSNVSQDRIYMPGDLIIEEGRRGDSMFIMVSGQAMVFVMDSDENIQDQDRKRDQDSTPSERKSVSTVYSKSKTKTMALSRIGMLTAGSISGELAMLGVSVIRSATIEAQTICSMWEITQEKALAILERFPDAQQHFANLIVEHLERTVPGRILSIPLFRGFDRKFRMLISLYCERRAYFPGQKITREGQPGDRLYIVNQGRATLEKKGVTVKTYPSGSYFGSTVMVGIHKIYLGSLSALQTCHILSVSRVSYHQALEQYPSHSAAQELKRTEKIASEELREAVQRISTRKLIWKRYQVQLMDASNPETQKMTAKQLLERAVQVWSERVKTIVKLRRQRDAERAQYDKMMEQWVKKKRDAREKVRMREEGNSRPNTVNPPSARRKELVRLLEDWPTPRPSPHYRLRVFGVLQEAAKRPATGAPLLPLLKEKKIRNGGGKMVEGEGF